MLGRSQRCWQMRVGRAASTAPTASGKVTPPCSRNKRTRWRCDVALQIRLLAHLVARLTQTDCSRDAESEVAALHVRLPLPHQHPDVAACFKLIFVFN
jgi:hypothetical protein